MSNIRGVPDFEGFGVLFGDADGNLDASGPPATIDLDEEKVDLLQDGELETDAAISASFSTLGDGVGDIAIRGVPTSTPLDTPIHSPDWQAAVESNSVRKARGIFEQATGTTVKPAYSLRSSGMPS